MCYVYCRTLTLHTAVLWNNAGPLNLALQDFFRMYWYVQLSLLQLLLFITPSIFITAILIFSFFNNGFFYVSHCMLFYVISHWGHTIPLCCCATTIKALN